jgi:phosphopantothenoylcysteine decarboxylase / phosphopantothenate---cysteine ligase
VPNIVLGVSGSVASYRAADVARELMRAGYGVRVCLTDAAQKFVTPALFEALTGQPCLIDTFEEPQRGRMAHIEWARQASVLLLAPSSANTISKVAHGIADDMLSTIALAFTGPIVVAPAMNPSMYMHDATRRAIDLLRSRASVFVEPDEGDVACGEHGQGKLASVPRIVEATLSVANLTRRLEGKKVLITSGPTHEPIDDVRFIGNRSSGKMGAALARAALLMGAEVHVVTGPTSTALPIGAQAVRVTTAEEMLEAALALAPECDLIIGAAAVADYRPASRLAGKMRREADAFELKLIKNPDVIARLAETAHSSATVVAFAAEPDESLEAAKRKLEEKNVAAIAVNEVGAGRGFDSDDNEFVLLQRDGVQLRSGRKSKLECALWLLEELSKQPSH